MGPDLPVAARVPRSFLLSLKYLLIEWDFAKKSINVDTDEMVLTVEGKRIVKAFIHGDAFELQWLEKEWSDWQELRADAKFQELQVVSQEKINRAKATASKGKGGKGKKA